MAVLTYQKIALNWQPSDTSATKFHAIAAFAVCVAILFAGLVSSIQLPQESSHQRAQVPARIAKFIAQRPAPVKPVVVDIQPKVPPKPVANVEAKPKIERQKPSDVKQKPLTKKQQEARKTAQKSGLLAVANELNDLMDTSEVSAKLAGDVSKKQAGAQVMAGHDTSVITSGVAKGGGGIAAGRYGNGTSTTKIDGREISRADSALFAEDASDNSPNGPDDLGHSGQARANEEISIAFDRNKGALYSLYERERRKTPGLQGKIVLQITVAANGHVTSVKIVSSELNNPSLEARIVSRVKQFTFSLSSGTEVTVTYPIEFLPS